MNMQNSNVGNHHGEDETPTHTSIDKENKDVNDQDEDIVEMEEEIFTVISKEQASSLIQKMVSLGYFHGNGQDDKTRNNLGEEKRSSSLNRQVMSVESLRQEQTHFMNRMKIGDPECEVVFPIISNNYDNNKFDDKEQERNEEIYCMTRDHLKNEIYSMVLQERRISLDIICNLLKVPMVDIQRAAKEVVILSSAGNQIHLIDKQHELVTDSYINELFQTEVVPELDQMGSICVSDLSMTIFHLPVEFMVDMIGQRLHTNEGMNVNNQKEWSFRSDVTLITINGVRKIITTAYEKMKNDQVRNILVMAVEPIKVSPIFMTNILVLFPQMLNHNFD